MHSSLRLGNGIIAKEIEMEVLRPNYEAAFSSTISNFDVSLLTLSFT